MIYLYLPVQDLLTMRQVSVHNRRVARDKELWKWTRIDGMELYRDKKYFTRDRNRITGTKLADMQDLLAEELAWIVSRVKYALSLIHI